MATIPSDRMYPYTKASAEGPPTLWFPVTASQTLSNGAAIVASITTGRVLGVSNIVLSTNAASCVGILEAAIAAPAVDTLIPVTITLPNFIWEGSATKGSAAVAGDLHVSVATANIATINVCGIGTSATTAAVRPFGFVGHSFAVAGYPYMDKVATSASISSTSFTQNTSKGIIGDTNPRMVFMWTPTACSLLQLV